MSFPVWAFSPPFSRDMLDCCWGVFKKNQGRQHMHLGLVIFIMYPSCRSASHQFSPSRDGRFFFFDSLQIFTKSTGNVGRPLPACTPKLRHSCSCSTAEALKNSSGIFGSAQGDQIFRLVILEDKNMTQTGQTNRVFPSDSFILENIFRIFQNDVTVNTSSSQPLKNHSSSRSQCFSLKLVLCFILQ